MISFELRDRVYQFVDGEISAAQLEEWMVPRLRLLLESVESADADVVAAIELGLAEMSDGIRTEAQFRDLMKQVLREHAAASVFLRGDTRDETTSANGTSALVLPVVGTTRLVWRVMSA